MSDQRSYPSQSAPRRRPSLLGFLIFPLLAFLIGLLVMGYALRNWDGAARYLGIEQQRAPAQLAQAPAPPTAQPAHPAIPLPADVEGRLALVEQRVAQLDVEAREAVGNADRAEGLLVAFAARRALDRGVELGYLEGLLRQRFGQSQQQAVATIITAARQPVTLEDLQQGLQEVEPALSGGGSDRSWWSALRAEVGNLVTVRKAGTPSTLPGERLARATRRLEAGQVDVALAEVLRLPGRTQAEDWIARARRYVAARRALDTIETAALLESRAQAQAMPVRN